MRARFISVPVVALIMMIGASLAVADEALAKASGCLRCHATEKDSDGPAFRNIAHRYRNEPRAPEFLAEKIARGGKGNWTEVTGGLGMPRHAGRLKPATIRQLVDWILSL